MHIKALAVNLKSEKKEWDSEELEKRTQINIKILHGLNVNSTFQSFL